MRAMETLSGVVPIVPTPFTEAEEVDHSALTRVVDHIVSHGGRGMTMFGLASEYYKLGDVERQAVIRTLVKAAAGRAPTVISITQHATHLAVGEAQYAAAEGADALMILPPFFLNPGAADIKAHIEAIARAVDLPIVVQYAPAQTGIGLPSTFFVDLQRRHPHVHYVKVESHPPGLLISEIQQESGGSIKTLIGYAGLQLMDALERGAVGVMPGAAIPEIYAAIFRHWEGGKKEEARGLHQLLLPLISFMMQSVEMAIRCDKALLVWRGILETDTCRRPCFDLDEGHRRQLRLHFERILPHLDD